MKTEYSKTILDTTFDNHTLHIDKIVEVDPDTKVKSAKTAMLFSRANTLLSLPMLLSMVAAQNLY